MLFVLGVLVGFIIGFVTFARGELNSEINATQKGVVKLNGDFYKITKITQENENED